jgi:ATP-dependent DNA helicase RecQ
VTVLAGWDWDRRPGGVVTIASRSRPLLVSSIGRRVAELGRLPQVGELVRAGPVGAATGGSGNSAQRVRAVHGSFAVRPQLESGLATLDGAPVLLVDDRVDSGWTMTVAAALLRRHGAGPVLPLALAATQ